jgi:protein tyrosine phosphatase (PTP) superfamily phosphohydrolase (DUF442 family)
MSLFRIISRGAMVLFFALCLAIGCRRPAPPAATKPAAEPKKLATQHLPNAVRVHDKVISGGLPAGDKAFSELEELGVKTIISVDGAQPDVAMAKKHGLRYVHLPHGYDGISTTQAALLAKAVRDLPGPIYIHCHHGKHRSPAAAAVACVGAGLIPRESSAAILKLAGTSPNYRGLYVSAARTQPLNSDELDRLPADFPESVKPSELAQAMVALEHTHDHVKQLASNKWRALEKSPDLESAHEALLLREHYTELLRAEAVQSHPQKFRELLKTGEAAAQELEESLNAWKQAGMTAAAPVELDEALAHITQNCTTCHQQFRDVPRNDAAK